MKYTCLLLIGLLLGLFSVSVSSACTPPPKTTISYTWSAGAVVTVNYDSTVNSSTILSELQAVVTNWNAALAGSDGGRVQISVRNSYTQTMAAQDTILSRRVHGHVSERYPQKHGVPLLAPVTRQESRIHTLPNQ
jgi:hypothetical protein